MVVSGATSSGKSYFIKRLCKHANEMVSPPCDLIIYCYETWTDGFKDMPPEIVFHKGFDESVICKEKIQGRSVMLILDDLMLKIDPQLLLDTFLVKAHHEKINPIFICHNLYFSGLKALRTINLNTCYNVLMKNFRDISSVRTLGSQMYPAGSLKFFLECYTYATKEAYSYLLIDSKPTQRDEVRLRTRIFPGEDTICFVKLYK